MNFIERNLPFSHFAPLNIGAYLELVGLSCASAQGTGLLMARDICRNRPKRKFPARAQKCGTVFGDWG
jgi:hypothetical protein